MTGGGYKCGSTTGQTAIGLSTASGLQVFAGFWLPDYGVGIREAAQWSSGQALRTQLEAVRPNPVRGRAVIRYALDAERRVSLSVCDLTGRVVRTLACGNQRCGAYSVVWDGRDGRGRLLPRGVYLVRFAAGDHCATEKLVLQR
jgi:hypothetical protein